jgi:hypothetical protein
MTKSHGGTGNTTKMKMKDEPIRFWAAIYHETDGFTYEVDIVLGIYSERSKADERCLTDLIGKAARKIDDYRVEEHVLDEDWE